MAILSSIYAPFATEDNKFNLDKFVQAAILFEEIQLSNTSLVPQLIRAAGIDGFVQLLDEKVIRLVGGGPNVQGKFDYTSPGFYRNKPSIYQPLNFGFETIYVDCDSEGNLSIDERLARDLTETRKLMTVSDNELNMVIDSSAKTLQVLKGQALDTRPDFNNDVKNYQPFVAGTIINSIAAQGVPIHVYNWKLNVEQVEDDIYRVDSNLSKLLRISEQQVHELVKVPFYKLTGTNLQLRRMREVNAASGLSDVQSAITSRRLDHISQIHIEADKRDSMTRIAEFAEVPELVPLDKLDVSELIELRNSNEARIFRDFINRGGGIDENELREVLTSWRAKLGEKWKSKKTQSLRWLAATGSGPFIEPATGVALGIVDQFLGKLLGDMGPIGFIESDYRRFIEDQKKVE